MNRIKLFVVQRWEGHRWESKHLHRGDFRTVLSYAQAKTGFCTRVKRVKTPAERDKYLDLDIRNPGIERTEWVN